MSYNHTQFKNLIERVLRGIDLYSPEAVSLLLGTAAVESDFGTFLVQLGSGPARGPFGMEPTTERCIWDNYLEYKFDLKTLVIMDSGVCAASALSLETNLLYSIAMARVHYRRKPGALPKTLEGQAQYWKKFYNTEKGKGTVEDYMKKSIRYCHG
jgi:hypothetical protein